MPDFMKILQQAQEMQGRFQKIQDDLQHQTLTGSAGGGLSPTATALRRTA